jgi:hypothetical protein
VAESKENAAAEKATGIDRREAMLRILRLAGIGAGTVAAGYWLSKRSMRPVEELVVGARRDHTIAANAALPEMAVIRGGNPRELVQRALEELGGIRRFIGRTDVVIVKPNIAWDRTPEQAANTNPETLGSGREKSDCDGCELQRPAALLRAVGDCGGGAASRRRGNLAGGVIV